MGDIPNFIVLYMSDIVIRIAASNNKKSNKIKI